MLGASERMKTFVMTRTTPVAAALLACLFATEASAQQTTNAADRWNTVKFLLGTWEGTTQGEPGSGTVRRQYHQTLGDQFIEVRNTSTYPPQDKNRKGETHSDVGYISFDKTRKRLVLRQFHVEGFVNQYVQDEGTTPTRVVFTSEAIENIAAGWRARETYTVLGPDEFEELFELAAPGRPFETYSRSRLRRVK